jgi:hypothetical protein
MQSGSNDDKMQKKLLLELMKETSETPSFFRPTIADIDEWYNVINSVVFKNQIYIPLDRIEVRRRLYVWGDYIGRVTKKKTTVAEKRFGEGLSCTLRMTDKFPSKKFFVQILAHEMVHHYQFTCEKPLFESTNISHGKTFWRWKKTFEKYGLNLKRIAKEAK